MIIKLSKEYLFEGKSYTAVDLDLESLTGADIEAAEQTAVMTTGTGLTNFAEFCKPFQIALAARAAKQPVEFIRKMPAKDCSKITLAVGNFLVG